PARRVRRPRLRARPRHRPPRREARQRAALGEARARDRLRRRQGGLELERHRGHAHLPRDGARYAGLYGPRAGRRRSQRGPPRRRVRRRRARLRAARGSAAVQRVVAPGHARRPGDGHAGPRDATPRHRAAGPVGLAAAALPFMLWTGAIERRRALAGGAGRATGPAGVQRWLTWRRALLSAASGFGLLGLVTATHAAMRQLGIGPVGTLVASGVLAPRGRLGLAGFENRPA